MSKAPSPETQLRSAKREIRGLLGTVKQQADDWRHWRTRAIKAEQEAAEWKARFDALLKRHVEGTTEK